MKRFISLALSLLMILSCFPLNVFASEAETQDTVMIYVENTYCIPGENVKVNINVLNNPGVAGARFEVLVDDTLSLVSANEEDGVFASLDFGGIETTSSPYILSWVQ